MITPCIQSIQLKNFRCFTQVQFSLDAPVVLIEGGNGSGKTSLLEAIHYLCYVRSFRTHIPHDLVNFGNEGFFIAAKIQDDLVTIGSSGAKRQVKINQKAVTSHKELRTVCKVVTVTQDDTGIVTGSPEKRRTFLDHALVLYNDELTETMKLFRHILETRNAFLMQGTGSAEEFDIWTYKLWKTSQEIQKSRTEFLDLLLSQGKALEGYFLEAHTFSISYITKHLLLSQTYEEFFASSARLFERERYFRRSLFGAHLDDIEIIFNGKPARMFSSRGQQKLLTLFLKISQAALLKTRHTQIIFLLDDFLSDFDMNTLFRVIKICLTVQAQLIFTTPLSSSPEELALVDLKCDFLKVSI